MRWLRLGLYIPAMLACYGAFWAMPDGPIWRMFLCMLLFQTSQFLLGFADKVFDAMADMDEKEAL